MRLMIGTMMAVALAVPVVIAPVAGAHHGERGVGTARLLDGTTFDVVMAYQREAMGLQVWAFKFVRDDGRIFDCVGYGSIEDGFKSGLMCPVRWSTNGTGEFHAYPYFETDHHVVPLSFGSAAGSFDMWILPDSGA